MVVLSVVKYFILEKKLVGLDHSIDSLPGEEPHLTMLLKMVAEKAAKIFAEVSNKRKTAIATGNKVSMRQKLNKIVLVNNM